MKKISFILLIVMGTLLNSCGPAIDVTYDYDRSVDFTKFKTFAIAEWNKDNSELVDDFTKVRMLNAMRKQMELRGLKEVKENQDITLDIFVVTDAEKYTTAYTTHMGYGGYGYGGWYGGWYGGMYGPYGGIGYSSTQFVDHERLIGTIIVDVYNEKTKQLAWQGVAKGELDNDTKPTARTIDKMMDRMFYKYPVRKK